MYQCFLCYKAEADYWSMPIPRYLIKQLPDFIFLDSKVENVNEKKYRKKYIEIL